MVQGYDGDHIDLSGARVDGDVNGKVENHFHGYPPPVPAPSSPLPPLGTPLSGLSPADAHTFEVHEVADPSGTRGLPPLPPYLHRPGVDGPLRAAVRAARGSSRMVLLVGGSSVGKTRACWEAVHAELPPDWRLWHPLSPSRPEALLDALRTERIAPRTVVWLNEAQLYLNARGAVEAIQGALSDASLGPVLFLGSLWPEYWTRLGDETRSGRESRLLLERTEDITVPTYFTSNELRSQAGLVDSDPRLAWALGEGEKGQLTQALSGALDLVRRYRHATPAERAVLEAAMDFARLSEVRRAVPGSFLRAAAASYLPTGEPPLDRKRFREAVGRLCERGLGTPGPLVPSSRGEASNALGRMRGERHDPKYERERYRLTDYLEEYGRERRRAVCPPESFWAEAGRSSTDRSYLGHNFARAAEDRLRLRHAEALHGATPFPTTGQLETVALIKLRGGDYAGAEGLAADTALRGRPRVLTELLLREDDPRFLRRACALLAETVGPEAVLDSVGTRFDRAGEEERRSLLRLLDEVVGPEAVLALAEQRKPHGDWSGVRLCLERSAPERLTGLDRHRAVWDALWKEEVDAAIEAGRRNPRALDSLLDRHLHTERRGAFLRIVRRAVAGGVHVPLLQRLLPHHSHAPVTPWRPGPLYEEMLETLADSGDPVLLTRLTRQMARGRTPSSAVPLALRALRAGISPTSLVPVIRSLTLSGHVSAAERIRSASTGPPVPPPEKHRSTRRKQDAGSAEDRCPDVPAEEERRPDVSEGAARLAAYVRRAEESGLHAEAEETARTAADAGLGEVLEDLAHARAANGPDPEYWAAVRDHGLDPDGEPARERLPRTRARGDLRPVVTDGGVSVCSPGAEFNPRGRIERQPESDYFYLLPLVLFLPFQMLGQTLSPMLGPVLVLGGIVSSLALFPLLTADVHEFWRPRRRGMTGVVLLSAILGPAAVAALAASVARRKSLLRRAVIVVTTPLSLAATVLFTAAEYVAGYPALTLDHALPVWIAYLFPGPLLFGIMYALYRNRRNDYETFLQDLRSRG